MPEVNIKYTDVKVLGALKDLAKIFDIAIEIPSDVPQCVNGIQSLILPVNSSYTTVYKYPVPLLQPCVVYEIPLFTYNLQDFKFIPVSKLHTWYLRICTCRLNVHE